MKLIYFSDFLCKLGDFEALVKPHNSFHIYFLRLGEEAPARNDNRNREVPDLK